MYFLSTNYMFNLISDYFEIQPECMDRSTRRKVLSLASGPSNLGGKKDRRGWYHNPKNCPPWWHGDGGRIIEWKSPNHPPNGAFLTVNEEITLIRNLQQFTQKVCMKIQFAMNIIYVTSHAPTFVFSYSFITYSLELVCLNF